MNLLEKFAEQLKKDHHTADGLLVAVSGGADSVVLCDLCHKTNVNFMIAHCNFKLRGAESERDEAFVKALAAGYNKELFVSSFDTEAYAEANKISIQVAARELRYQWFRQLLHEGDAKWIVTAHHADDNIETVVMNFFRGTGLKGLAGMDVHFNGIYRPLLEIRKQEIVDYAKANNLQFVEDSSNANSYYTRNYFRNEMLPAIANVFPAVEENLLNNIHRFSEAQQLYDEAIALRKKKLVELKGVEEHIPVLKLQKSIPLRTIIWEVIKEKGFTAGQVDEVVKLMDADTGSFILSPTHRILKNRKWLIISPLTSGNNSHIVIENSDTKIVYSDCHLSLQNEIDADSFKIPTAGNIACFDSSQIKFPLVLRRWKRGDYFYPLGMKKKKKLNRFLIDQKLSLIQKEKIWVIEMDKKIIWVVGYRIDDRFKISPSTKSILQMRVTN